jgi:enolase
MIIPVKATSLHAMQMGSEIFHSLKKSTTIEG